ncbi:MAG: hypothetical protein KAI74_01460, partial [Kiritimatiellae bacterium]|nr:hypothetical protein [Kiritimatiellia bacterium]
MNMIIYLTVPVCIIVSWLLFEIIRFLRIRKEKQTSKLIGWMLRPWSAWAIINLIYQLNPGKGLDAMDSAPTFTSWIFPLFLHPWNRDESIGSVFTRLATTPTVYIWGVIVALLTLILVFLVKLALSNRAEGWKRLLPLLIAVYIVISVLQLSIASLPNGP